jgi:hypothetical protein
MTYVITTGSAANGNDVSLADNTVVSKGSSVTISFPSPEVISAVASGMLTITPALPVTYTFVDSTTGTAPAAVAGVVTIPAVTSYATAANAIAALIAQVANLNAIVALLLPEIEMLGRKTSLKVDPINY